jgi:hypothetical protein
LLALTHTNADSSEENAKKKPRKIFGEDVGKNLGFFHGEIKPLRWCARTTNSGLVGKEWMGFCGELLITIGMNGE